MFVENIENVERCRNCRQNEFLGYVCCQWGAYPDSHPHKLIANHHSMMILIGTGQTNRNQIQIHHIAKFCAPGPKNG